MRGSRRRAHGRAGRYLRANHSVFSKKKVLKNKKVIVTAGPCREAIDPVRYISNKSSGKMGYAIARAAVLAGADVTLISGPTNISIGTKLNLIKVETTEQMYVAVKNHFNNCDILIMAAAPADFTLKNKATRKIKKGNEIPALELSSTIDILNSLKKIKKPDQKVIGFALETENGIANASAKLKSKNLDLIVLNSLEECMPFDGESNKVTLIDKNGGIEPLNRMSKTEVARILIERVAGIK